ncbi:MAG: hypothetical protein KDA79_10925, partial [Planctomycetaceae bacterium]|nr:hypothetical protein [Planctomycetaceae bacterium]
AEGEIPFLTGRRFLWLDCSNIGSEASRACLETILAVAAELPEAVLCLDGLAALLRRPSGGTNIPLLRAAAARPGLRIIGILSRHEFSELIGSDARLLELFARIETDEPSEETALAIARQAVDGLSREYRLSVSDEVVRRAVGLTGSFLLNERHPARAIRVLRRCCEEADYERTQLGRERTDVTADDVTGVVFRN